MKKLMIVVLSAGLALGASAQRGGHIIGGGGGFAYRPHVAVGFGYGVGYGLGYGWGYPAFGFGYPLYGYGPWGYPYPPYYYGRGAMPSGLNYQIEGIRNDYKAQIKETRHDKSLTHKEKRQKIDQLKTDRDKAVVQARKDYFNNSRRNYYNRDNNNGNNGNNNGNGNNGNNNGNGNNGNKGNQNENNGNGSNGNGNNGNNGNGSNNNYNNGNNNQ